uniref:protein mono-ADP-ribosyltransferase TIPARP-like isoform X2 n=1 Tax=Myxine glutinosa TaxID=7769 RepID=UPI0035902285
MLTGQVADSAGKVTGYQIAQFADAKTSKLPLSKLDKTQGWGCMKAKQLKCGKNFSHLNFLRRKKVSGLCVAHAMGLLNCIPPPPQMSAHIQPPPPSPSQNPVLVLPQSSLLIGQSPFSPSLIQSQNPLLWPPSPASSVLVLKVPDLPSATDLQATPAATTLSSSHGLQSPNASVVMVPSRDPPRTAVDATGKIVLPQSRCTSDVMDKTSLQHETTCNKELSTTGLDKQDLSCDLLMSAQADDELVTPDDLDLVSSVLQLAQRHTHVADGIDICAEFLAAECDLWGECPRHHTTLPYHWQLRRRIPTPTGTNLWESLPEAAQEGLERLYCDPERDAIEMHFQMRRIRVDLNTLTTDDVVYDRMRRLSVGRSIERITEFSTVWKIYWKDDLCWREYDELVSRQLEATLVSGHAEARFTLREHSYLVNYQEMFQQNVLVGTRRKIARRPVFQSPVLLLPLLKTVRESADALGKGLGENEPPASPLGPSLFPLTWLPMGPCQDFLQVAVGTADRAFRTVYSLFHKTMPETKAVIVDIFRIQNPFLWEKYTRKKEYMGRRLSLAERLTNERHLFHGTSPEAALAICKHNFDPRVSGKHATAYGQGSYFARRSNYSHGYARPDAASGLRCMFLAKVLVGRHAQGRPAFRRPPPFDPCDPASDLFDSCVDSTPDPQIFVVFDGDQCYPYFLIRYRLLDNTLVV